MKAFLLAAVLLSELGLHADPFTTNAPSPQFKLAWDRSASDFLTNGVTYTLSGVQKLPAVTNYVTMAGVTNSVVSLDGVASGAWTFNVVAVQAGISSLPSNSLLLTVPVSPFNLRPSP
jgi:hypothetical protein